MKKSAPSRTRPAAGRRRPPRRDNGSRFSELIECFDCGLVVFASDLSIVACNSRARAMLGDARGMGESLAALTMDDSYIDWPSEIRWILSSGMARRFDALSPARHGQPERWLELTITAFDAADIGAGASGLLMVQDVTSRITMERRLAVSERLAAVGKMAARVAHELNNPLDGILRYTNLAARLAQQHGDAKLAEYLDQARSGIHRMAQIVAALLEFSRSAPGAGEQATLNRLIEDAVGAMEGRAREAGITVVCNFAGTDLPVIRGTGLFQVACNLIKNAIDAMPEGGTLTIATALAGGDIVMTVDDTGVGLPEEMERIFEPFFTTKEAGKGTGLGLAVCKELIERYGGTIVPSRRHPRGTRMTVRIPMRNCSSTAGA